MFYSLLFFYDFTFASIWYFDYIDKQKKNACIQTNHTEICLYFRMISNNSNQKTKCPKACFHEQCQLLILLPITNILEKKKHTH